MRRKRLKDQNGYFWVPRPAIRPRGKALPTTSSLPFGLLPPTAPRTAQQRGFAPFPLRGAPRSTKDTVSRRQSSDGTAGWDAGTHRGSTVGRRGRAARRQWGTAGPAWRRARRRTGGHARRHVQTRAASAPPALPPPARSHLPAPWARLGWAGPPRADVSLLSPDTARGRAQRRAFALPLSARRPGAEGGPLRSAHPTSRRARPRSICLQPITSPPPVSRHRLPSSVAMVRSPDWLRRAPGAATSLPASRSYKRRREALGSLRPSQQEMRGALPRPPLLPPPPCRRRRRRRLPPPGCDLGTATHSSPS